MDDRQNFRVPLFMLPNVVLTEIFSILHVLELCKLAQASERTKIVIQKCYRGHLAVKIQFHEDHFSQVIVFDKTNQERCWKIIFYNHYDTMYIKKDGVQNEVVVKCEDVVERTVTFAEHISHYLSRIERVESLSIRKFYLFETGFEASWDPICKWLSCQDPDVLNIYFNLESVRDMYFQKFFSSLNKTDHLRVAVEPSAHFDARFQINSNFFYLENSHWVNLNVLMAMDCKNVVLNNSLMSSSDINQFLRYWVNGQALVDLSEFQLKADYLSHNEILSGLRVQRLDADYIKHHLDLLFVSQWTVIGGVIITRGDGLRALIPHYQNYCNGTTIHGLFHMHILTPDFL